MITEEKPFQESFVHYIDKHWILTSALPPWDAILYLQKEFVGHELLRDRLLESGQNT